MYLLTVILFDLALAASVLGIVWVVRRAPGSGRTRRWISTLEEKAAQEAAPCPSVLRLDKAPIEIWTTS